MAFSSDNENQNYHDEVVFLSNVEWVNWDPKSFLTFCLNKFDVYNKSSFFFFLERFGWNGLPEVVKCRNSTISCSFKIMSFKGNGVFNYSSIYLILMKIVLMLL